MNREIKFRAKRLDNYEWVYGNYIIDNWGDENNNIIYGILEDRKAPSFIENWIPVKVNNNTLGQFTGLKDKNDKEIYEGDIVLSQDLFKNSKSKPEKIIGYVIYHIEEGFNFYNKDTEKFDLHKQYGAGFTIKFGKEQYKYRHWDWGEFYDCEVIGNIYDNPEILGAKNEEYNN